MGAWIDLLILATHKQRMIRVRGVRVIIERGDVAVAHLTLAARWKWSRGKVKRFLDELEDAKQIVQRTNNVITCISILNYSIYQNGGTTNGTAEYMETISQTVQHNFSSSVELSRSSSLEALSGGTTDNTAERLAYNTTDRITNGQQTDSKRTHTIMYNNENTVHTHSIDSDPVKQNAPASVKVPAPARSGGAQTADVIDCTGALAAELLAWTTATRPDVQQMPEPLTMTHARWMVSKYPFDDIKRILRQMHNKKATINNVSAYDTFVSYAGRDTILKERKSAAGKFYTFEQKSGEILDGKAKESDFIFREVDGHKLWQKITDIALPNT